MSSKFERLTRKPIVAQFLRQPILCRILLAAVVGILLMSMLSVSVWSCPVLRICKVPCPGCGLTRSMKFLLCGDVINSIRYHPLGLAALLSGIVLTAGAMLPRRARVLLAQFVSPIERKIRLHGVLLIALIFLWILRILGSAMGFISLQHLSG